ncbi:MAG: heat shock protein HspQ [Gammaproteobacteria bacterium]|nr:heat shock protein HspQ [Gammaproteobacteria bacterium]
MPDQAKFSIGQIIQHKLFGYRGVIFEIDPVFMLSDEWYQQVAKSRPPREEPWYHIMVDNALHTTYVAQQNLDTTKDLQPIDHPDIDELLGSYDNGQYHIRKHQLQ